MTHYALFDTAFGTCGIAWGPAGIIELQLPEKNARATVARLRQRLHARGPSPEQREPSTEALTVIDAVREQLASGAVDVAALDVALDLAASSPFARRIYEALRGVPRGKTVSYRELAERAGAPKAARAVGAAMAKNPLPLLVPCHRVLAAGGGAGGFSCYGGTVTKARLLALEGIALMPAPSPTDGYPFDASAARRKLARGDGELALLMRRVGPFRMQLKQPRSTFTALAEAIVYQQLTAKAAGTIFGRVEALFGGRALRAEDVAAASDAALRSAGLSGAKAAALRDLADKTLAGAIPTLAKLRAMEDDDIVAVLTNVRGIGRWTVEMLLIFQLGRPDVLPLNDYGLRKAFSRTFGDANGDGVASGASMAERGERWRPYRTMASWYLWRALEL